MTDSLEVEYVDIDQLTPYCGNAKMHPRQQVEQIAKSIKEFGMNDPVAVWTNPKGELEIVEGHGRLYALDMLGIREVPIIRLDRLTDEQRRAYTHVHNQLTLNSGFDLEVLNSEMESLPDFDWEAFGFDGIGEDEEEEDETYTRATNVPQYEPTGNVPMVTDIVDTAKAKSLIETIDASSVSEEEKAFLRLAACRHYRFDYRAAAEYYAAAGPEMQALMEQSALVLIDVDDAIRYGYASLSEDIERMAIGDEDA